MKKIYIALFLLLSLHFSTIKANTAERIVFDPEVEDIITEMAACLFEVAGLDMKRIKVILVVDEDINAFVSPDNQVFINLGLLSETEKPEEVLGVLAHEIAHISLKHLNKRHEEIKDAIRKSIFQIPWFRIMPYSVMQEYAADKTAVIYLKKLGISTAGLISVLKRIKERSIAIKRSPLMSHPMLKDRINYLSENKTVDSNKLLKDPDFLRRYSMMLAKVRGYTWDEDRIQMRYQGNDPEALYAKSLFLYQSHKLNETISKINQLINLDKFNPYFYEFKGQVTLEMGSVADAIALYGKAFELLPTSVFLQKELIDTLLVSKYKTDLDKAYALCKSLLNKDEDAFAFEKMGLAQSKLGHNIASYIYFARAAICVEDVKRAKHFLAMIGDNTKGLSEELNKLLVQVKALLSN
jgi:predicted Zn-dependent protease